MLDKRDEENVDFDEFLHSIKTILLYDNYFEELEPMFKHLDPSGSGRIRSQDLLDACTKLENEQTDLRMTPNALAEKIYNRMVNAGNVEISDYLTLAEYQIFLFKATQDDDWNWRKDELLLIHILTHFDFNWFVQVCELIISFDYCLVFMNIYWLIWLIRKKLNQQTMFIFK